MTTQTLTVNGIDFNVDINMDEIEVTNINGEKVAFAEIDGNMEQGSYTIYDEDGEGEENALPRELYDDMADGDGVETAVWLCSVSFN